MALRLFLLVLATSLLSLTTSPIQLTDAVEKLLAPFRRLGVPSHELAMVSNPAIEACPLVGANTPARIRIAVVFPAPFGPRNPVILPLSMRNVRSSRARTAPKVLVR